ncbi:head-tail connector protein [Budvicia aquatica]|uniref:head-tail connector protein n=1 Tax=Budvicia aquatica TaxID=82979 RepID=UPI0034CDF0C2
MLKTRLIGLCISLIRIPPEGDNLLMDGDIVTAMLLLIGHWYENRESVIIGTQASVVPIATDILLQPYRVYGL